jgi:hypothetical protein
MSSRGGSKASKPTAPPKIFISHSSKDRALAQSLMDLLTKALRLPSEQIRCTSVNGLEGGVPIEEQILFEVEQADVLIGLISEASLESLYVAFELGARWHAKKPLIPLLAYGLDPRRVPEPLSSKNAVNCGDEKQLLRLIEELAKHLHVRRKPIEKSSAFYPNIETVCKYSRDRTSPAWYGIQFTTPEEGATITTDKPRIEGTYQNWPTDGELQPFNVSVDKDRRWTVNVGNRWWPVGEALEHKDSSWWGAMEFSKGEFDAWIVIALVSKSSVDLVHYFKKLPRELESRYEKTTPQPGQLRDHGEFNSLFERIKPDGIQVCAKRKVHVNI